MKPLFKVSPVQRLALTSALSSWNRLNDLLLLRTVTIDHLEALIQLELEGKGRQPILRKLVGRYYSMQRNQLNERVDQWLKEKKQRSKSVSGDGRSATGGSVASSRLPRIRVSRTASSSKTVSSRSSSSSVPAKNQPRSKREKSSN